jgi:hypothetical protein
MLYFLAAAVIIICIGGIYREITKDYNDKLTDEPLQEMSFFDPLYKHIDDIL